MGKPVTRRRAIQTAGLAAGLLGASGTPPVADAEMPESVGLAATLCRETRPEDNAGYREWLAEWRSDYQKAREKRDAIDARLRELLPAALHFKLVSALDAAIYEAFALESDRYRELMLRHLPGLEPVLRLLNAHIHEVHMGMEADCGDGGCRDGF